MPIYEYKCKDCGTKFEKLRSMKDADAVIECAKCSSLHTKRALSTCNCRHETTSSSHTGSSGSSGCSGCGGGSCSSCGH